jgi:hypothetical protein
VRRERPEVLRVAPICHHAEVQSHALRPSTRSLVLFALCAFASASCVYAVGLAAPSIPLAPTLAFALAYLFVTSEILALGLTAPRLAPAATAIGSAVAVVGVVLLAGSASTPCSAALLTLALGPGATLLGAALGARTDKPGQLAAVALVSSIADLWSVFDEAAPSARLAAQAMAQPEQLALFALPFPMLGTPIVAAVIGAGDVLFVALYVAAFRVHGLSTLRLSLALAAAFVLGLLGLLVALVPLPLLPLLGLAAVLSDPAARSLTAREWRTVLLVSAALLGAIALRLAR